MNIDDEVENNPEMAKKASFLSHDIWQDENAGSSSTSERNSQYSDHKGRKISQILKKKMGKGKKIKYFDEKFPNKMSAIE